MLKLLDHPTRSSAYFRYTLLLTPQFPLIEYMQIEFVHSGSIPIYILPMENLVIKIARYFEYSSIIINHFIEQTDRQAMNSV